jgi:RNA 2',3'-cyclic 3'-phosphodiesterase
VTATTDAGRYFFAVWPDDDVRAQLSQWSDAIRTGPPARRVPDSNLHITLVFLGNLESAPLEAVRTAAAQTPWHGATLTLDRVGHWNRSRVIWVGSGSGSEALTALAEVLRGRLRRLGFLVEERPFVPHVTLYRNAGRRPRWRRKTIYWQIDDFCLVRSTLSSAGARYEVVDRWSARDDVE